MTTLPSLVERIARDRLYVGLVNDDYAVVGAQEFAQAIAADIAEQISGNHILSGSPDWAFSWGWSSANEAAANLIRERYGLAASKPVVECEPPGPLVWGDEKETR